MSELQHNRQPTTVRFIKLSASGHDEKDLPWGEETEREFASLMKNGYAVFVNDTQVHTLIEAQDFWAELGGEEELMRVTAVPALRGGAD